MPIDEVYAKEEKKQMKKLIIVAIFISLTGVTAHLCAMEVQKKRAAFKIVLREALSREDLATASGLICTGGIPLGSEVVNSIKCKELIEGLVKQAIEEGHPLTVHILLAEGLLSKESAQMLFNEYATAIFKVRGKSKEARSMGLQKFKRFLQTGVVTLVDLNISLDEHYCYPKKRTVLMVLVVRVHKDVLELLLKAGADPNIEDVEGNTALMLDVCYLGHDYRYEDYAKVIDLLISAGTNIDKQNNYGKTALVNAIRCVDLIKVTALLDAGVDLTTKDKDGKTVLMHASEHRHRASKCKSIYKLLKKAAKK